MIARNIVKYSKSPNQNEHNIKTLVCRCMFVCRRDNYCQMKKSSPTCQTIRTLEAPRDLCQNRTTDPCAALHIKTPRVSSEGVEIHLVAFSWLEMMILVTTNQLDIYIKCPSWTESSYSLFFIFFRRHLKPKTETFHVPNTCNTFI